MIALTGMSPESSWPDQITEMGGRVYFEAQDKSYRRELWVSDGTEGGTTLVKKIDSSSSANPRNFTPSGDQLYYLAYEQETGIELWVSDGTESGTHLVKDIYPGGRGSSPEDMIVAGNKLFFTADDDTHGRELWVSDGTEAGTMMVKELTAGSSWSTNIGYFVPMAGAVYFEFQSVLWVSDGTEAGTTIVKDDAGSATYYDPYSLTVFDNALFFTAHDPIYGRNLWKTDGTEAGTMLVKATGSSTSRAHSLVKVENQLYFVDSDYPTEAEELWVSDGTNAAGTRLVKSFTDLNPGYRISNMMALNGYLFFTIGKSFSGSNTLWISDGTEAGTHAIQSTTSRITHLIGDNETNYFQTRDGDKTMLWSSDGSILGTNTLQTFEGETDDSHPSDLVTLDGKLYFLAKDGVDGRALWMTDGTEAGTVRVTNFEYGIDYDSTLISTGGKLYFTANDNVHGEELWVSDGTNTGTAMVKDIDKNGSGVFNFSQEATTLMGGRIYFMADDGIHGNELWVTDGTETGTLMVKDIVEGSANGLPYWDVKIYTTGTKVYFFSDDDELWVSDGTSVGTVPIKTFNYQEDLSNFSSAGNKLYFVVNRELWVSDGSTAGTKMIKAISGDDDRLDPGQLTPVGDKIYFTSDSDSGLWVSDGSEAGTLQVLEEDDYPYLFNLTAYAGKLYFFKADYDPLTYEILGSQLWSSNGSKAETKLLTAFDKTLFSGEFEPLGITIVDDQFYFFIDNAPFSTLWKSDGTATNTAAIHKGFYGDAEPEIQAAGEKLFFPTADFFNHGIELWMLDL